MVYWVKFFLTPKGVKEKHNITKSGQAQPALNQKLFDLYLTI
jgi:hypothetical protein